MSLPDDPVGMRIGELARRVGVSADVLRAWERRYSLLDPTRSRAGQRLYTAEDERRVRRMLQHMDAGYSPQVAARMVLGRDSTGGAPARHVAPPVDGAAATAGPTSVPAGVGAIERLVELVAKFEDSAAQAYLDRLLATYTLDAVLRDVVLPTLREIGECWERGELSVAHEHFASNLIGGRLRAVARSWDRGQGRLALVGCLPREHHDLGALCFSIALRERGWRVTWLGADVPASALAETADALQPDAIVLAAVWPVSPTAIDVGALRAIAARYALAIGGRAATRPLAEHLHAHLLPDDAIAAATALADVAR